MSDRGRCGADDEDGERPADPKCKGCEGKGKKTRFFRLRKRRRQKQRGVYVNSGWCCLCVKQPRTLDSHGDGESPSSDPNSSEFTFDMLRALIEQNDFYSKECNPHFDADGDACAKQNPNI